MSDCSDFSAFCSDRDPVSRAPSGRPADGEFADYAKPDIDRVIGDDAVRVLAVQAVDTLTLLESLNEASVNGVTYAPGKWTVKQVIGHLADAYLAKHEYRKALPLYRKVLQLEPERKDITEKIRKIRMEIGDK
jgi:hypothetical protein